MPNGQEENCGGGVLFEKVYQEIIAKKLDGTEISRNRIEVYLPTPRIGSLIFLSPARSSTFFRNQPGWIQSDSLTTLQMGPKWLAF